MINLCAECTGNANVYRTSPDGSDDFSYFVECIHCRLTSPHRLNKKDAMAAWNLMIAAPDLLAACERMMALQDYCDVAGWQPNLDCVCPGIELHGNRCHWCEMRAAIAKAKGEQ